MQPTEGKYARREPFGGAGVDVAIDCIPGRLCSPFYFGSRILNMRVPRRGAKLMLALIVTRRDRLLFQDRPRKRGAVWAFVAGLIFNAASDTHGVLPFRMERPPCEVA